MSNATPGKLCSSYRCQKDFLFLHRWPSCSLIPRYAGGNMYFRNSIKLQNSYRYSYSFKEMAADPIFHAKVFYRSMSCPYSYLSKDGIITGVLNVIQSYPKVGDYKVTEEQHFYKDLGIDKWDFIDVIQALQVEFRLYIPDEIVSCKLAIEYIYDHRMERLSPKEFQKRLFLTGEFGESKSEFRRMFVREGEIGTKYALSRHNNLYSGFTNWNGFKLFQFFKDLEGRWIFG